MKYAWHIKHMFDEALFEEAWTYLTNKTMFHHLLSYLLFRCCRQCNETVFKEEPVLATGNNFSLNMYVVVQKYICTFNRSTYMFNQTAYALLTKMYAISMKLHMSYALWYQTAYVLCTFASNCICLMHFDGKCMHSAWNCICTSSKNVCILAETAYVMFLFFSECCEKEFVR